ncbi:hypothetical protein Tco_0978093 [Tanacetum coccineum]|uniref:Uncharacterized protein n=1 Tax=Tanacetum coccineum TaxID=301880 RepID=A0ABQ5ELY1_9ASTR
MGFVSGWRLYPKSSVHVLDLTNGKTVYMFVDKFYPIRAPLLERMLRHRLTVPPSYCRDVVVAGSVIQTIQDGLRESYECLASAPIVDMVINPPWNLPFLGAKGLTSPEQTATGVNTPGRDENRLKFFDLMYILVNGAVAAKSGRLLLKDFSAFCVAAAASLECSLLPAIAIKSFLLLSINKVPADYVSAGHVLVPADRDIESADYVSAGHVLVPADRDRIC